MHQQHCEPLGTPVENHTEAYIRSVVKLTNIGGNELLLSPVKVKGFLKLAGVLVAMTCVECGIPMKEVDTEAICLGYRLAFPDNSEKLNKVLDALDEYSDWT